jgi:hypothetical protein
MSYSELEYCETDILSSKKATTITKIDGTFANYNNS